MWAIFSFILLIRSLLLTVRPITCSSHKKQTSFLTGLLPVLLSTLIPLLGTADWLLVTRIGRFRLVGLAALIESRRFDLRTCEVDAFTLSLYSVLFTHSQMLLSDSKRPVQ